MITHRIWPEGHKHGHVLVGEHEGDMRSLCGIVRNVWGGSGYLYVNRGRVPMCKRCGRHVIAVEKVAVVVGIARG